MESTPKGHCLEVKTSLGGERGGGQSSGNEAELSVLNEKDGRAFVRGG